YPLLLLEGCAAVILLINGRVRWAVLLGTLAIGSVMVVIVAARTTLGSFNAVVFSSRMPVITVGVLLSLVIVGVFAASIFHARKANRRLLMGLAFAGLPLLLTNQQILTGTMASAKEWERHIDLQLVVVAAGIWLSQFRWHSRWQSLAIVVATASV